MIGARVHRLAEQGRAPIAFHLDGEPARAMRGDTVLTAILSVQPHLRRAEFGPEGRAGFCLMGACQDCWVWQERGPRLRACSTEITEGMRLLSTPPEPWNVP